LLVISPAFELLLLKILLVARPLGVCNFYYCSFALSSSNFFLNGLSILPLGVDDGYGNGLLSGFFCSSCLGTDFSSSYFGADFIQLLSLPFDYVNPNKFLFYSILITFIAWKHDLACTLLKHRF
jgi:hypothetical protein